MSLTKRIEVDPSRFLSHIARYIKSQMKKAGVKDAFSFSREWEEIREKAAIAKEGFVSRQPWSELRAFQKILGSMPQNVNLFLSNGTAVRYAQILDYALPHASYCNRGVSGIDGSCSTAVGGAIAYKGKTVLITGDLSMAYDLGSLALPEIPDRMKIIVIDNCGGGIFRFIPTTSTLKEREEYFCAKPLLPLRSLAEGYGWEYGEAASEEELAFALARLWDSDKKGILRVVCDGEESAEILKGYMQEKC